VFLLEPAETQFDLKFWLFRTHVRVHPMFWAVSALLGEYFLKVSLGAFFSWIVCCFVSVVIHELGHVLSGRLFGSQGHIVLYSFGGLAIGSSDLARRWQRIIVYLAGPAAQLIVWVLVIAFEWYCFPLFARNLSPEALKFVIVLIVQLKFINLYWPILNLMPIWPLDGGRVSREVLDWLLPRNGISISLGISFSLRRCSRQIPSMPSINTSRSFRTCPREVGGALYSSACSRCRTTRSCSKFTKTIVGTTSTGITMSGAD